MSDDQDGCDCEWVNVLSGIGPTGWSHTKDHYTVVCVCVCFRTVLTGLPSQYHQ